MPGTGLENLKLLNELVGFDEGNQPVTLYEYEVADDGDCGFSSLGLSRASAIANLLTLSDNLKVRLLVSPEIKGAFLDGKLPWDKQSNLPLKQSLASYKTLSEHRSKASLTDRETDTYCLRQDVFEDFLRYEYLGTTAQSKSGLTYDFLDKQATGLFDALAFVNLKNLRIWKLVRGVLQVVHAFNVPNAQSTVQLFHTWAVKIEGEFSEGSENHYNLLSEQALRPVSALSEPTVLMRDPQDEIDEENAQLQTDFQILFEDEMIAYAKKYGLPAPLVRHLKTGHQQAVYFFQRPQTFKNHGDFLAAPLPLQAYIKERMHYWQNENASPIYKLLAGTSLDMACGCIIVARAVLLDCFKTDKILFQDPFSVNLKTALKTLDKKPGPLKKLLPNPPQFVSYSNLAERLERVQSLTKSGEIPSDNYPPLPVSSANIRRHSLGLVPGVAPAPEAQADKDDQDNKDKERGLGGLGA